MEPADDLQHAGPVASPDLGGPLDLDAIERDLAGVEAALARLDAGTYGVDEVTGEQLAPELLDAFPVARRTQLDG